MSSPHLLSLAPFKFPLLSLILLLCCLVLFSTISLLLFFFITFSPSSPPPILLLLPSSSSHTPFVLQYVPTYERGVVSSPQGKTRRCLVPAREDEAEFPSPFSPRLPEQKRKPADEEPREEPGKSRTSKEGSLELVYTLDDQPARRPNLGGVLDPVPPTLEL
ncbi:hypothetical protein GW17_00014539 [Ensete ventricosum]|nr:hypothetical protein GW17_00014539 [Ensete ventricosum]